MKTKETSFYRQFFALYISLVLQNVVTLSVNLTDNVMLGAYSETSLAGVTAAIMMRHGLVIMVLLFVLISLFPERAIGLFTTDGAIIRGGGDTIFVVKMDLISI